MNNRGSCFPACRTGHNNGIDATGKQDSYTIPVGIKSYRNTKGIIAAAVSPLAHRRHQWYTRHWKASFLYDSYRNQIL